MANKTQEMGPADLGLTITPQKVFGVENKTFSLILFRFTALSALPFLLLWH